MTTARPTTINFVILDDNIPTKIVENLLLCFAIVGRMGLALKGVHNGG